MGTITDLDGKFKLQAKQGDIIVISFIGYKTQELPAAAQMKVVLKDDSKQLDDVVVIGYGSVKKEDLSGSVVAIKAEEMNKGCSHFTRRTDHGKKFRDWQSLKVTVVRVQVLRYASVAVLL